MEDDAQKPTDDGAEEGALGITVQPDEAKRSDSRQDSPHSSEEVVKPKERVKPRVPSALTVENVKKHEEETDAIDVVELMTKNAVEEKCHSDSDNANKDYIGEATNQKTDEFATSKPHPAIDAEEPLDYPAEDRSATPIGKKMTRKSNEALKLVSNVWSQPKKQALKPIVSPAVRQEVRGTRFTGEEYLAVSIDVQTDESWIAEMFEWPQDNLGEDLTPFTSHPALASAAADREMTFSKDGKRYRKHVTSDLSSSEIVDEESVLHIAQSHSATSGVSVTLREKDCSTAESGTEDENVVTELAESEFGSFDALTHSTHGTSQTIPSVGPPYILQYKAESQMKPINYDDIDVTIPEGLNWDELSPEQRDYYKNIMEEMKRIREEKIAAEYPENELINIEPHAAYGSRQARKLAKERERERSRMREMEKQSKQATGSGGQVLANQTNFYAFARQLKTVNYSLSSEKCMEEGWTIRPLTPATPEEPPSEIFIHDPNDDIISGKRYEHMFVQKLYPNGELFLTVFPDGTGNVWYPSGNVAVSIIASEKMGKLVFILHEDIPPNEGQNIQAVFEPTGYCTCYYPSGVIRLLLTPFGGEYFSSTGERLKKWIWKDTQTHVHAPPFQPITFALSRKVGIRITSQESIYITFANGRRSVRFNAGTRLRLRPSVLLPKIGQLDADLVMLEEKRTLVQTILERINNSMKFPNSPRLKKLRLPNYLASQAEHAAKLKARLLEQQLEAGDAKKTKKPSSKRNKSSSVDRPMKASETAQKPRRRGVYAKKEMQDTDPKTQPVVVVN